MKPHLGVFFILSALSGGASGFFCKKEIQYRYVKSEPEVVTKYVEKPVIQYVDKEVIKYVDKEVIKYVEKPVVEYVEKPVVKYVDKEVVKWVEKEVIKYVDREIVRIEKPKETPFTYCPRGQGECRLGQGNNVTISDILCLKPPNIVSSLLASKTTSSNLSRSMDNQSLVT